MGDELNDELLRLFSRALVLLTQGIVEELRRALDVEVGCYLHLAGSAHVYERHWATPTWDNWERGELEIPWLADSVAETQSNARAALDEMRTAAWLRA